MSWAWVQSASGFNASATTSVTVSYATQNVAAGNKLIALVTSDASSGTITSVQDAALNSFTEVGSGVVSGTVSVSLWAIDVPAGDAGTKPAIKATFSVIGDMSLIIQEVSGLAPGNTLSGFIDGTAGTSTGSASPTTNPTYSSSVAGEYLVCCYGDNLFGGTYTTPSGYATDPANLTSTSHNHVAICWENSTGGSETGRYAFTGALHYGVILVAFQLASAVPVQFPAPVNMAVTATGRAGRAGASHSC